jgi:soluble lytic murein transglycosylase-like protein
MIKLSALFVVVSAFMATLYPSVALGRGCDIGRGTGLVGGSGAAERFAFSLQGCTLQAPIAPASEQLRVFESARAVDVIPTAERVQAVESDRFFSPPSRAGTQAVGARRFEDLVLQTARQHDIDPDLLHAIMAVESNANPRARSHAGAIGLMQVMPATGRRFGAIDLYDPVVNMRASAAYLKTLQRMFGNDLRLVLAAYNAGEGAVEKYGRQIPPYRETQAYVRNVMARYQQFLSQRIATADPR